MKGRAGSGRWPPIREGERDPLPTRAPGGADAVASVVGGATTREGGRLPPSGVGWGVPLCRGWVERCSGEDERAAAARRRSAAGEQVGGGGKGGWARWRLAGGGERAG